MRELIDCLDEIFCFERKENPLLSKLVQANISSGFDSKAAYRNQRIVHEESGCSAIVPHVHREQDKTRIIVYSAHYELEKEGIRLSSPFEDLNDCSRNYYGVYLSCLAYMMGLYSRVQLQVCMLDRNSDFETINYNPVIAERFLSHIAGKPLRAERPKEQTVRELQRTQQNLFAA